MLRTLITVLIILNTLILGGCCACLHKPVNPADPYERFNRNMYAFDRTIDKIVFRPVAQVYSVLTPSPVQQGVTNFFANIQLLDTFPNDILQGKFKYAITDVFRFTINSTIGLGGIIDVATAWHFPKHYNDFGLTFAYFSNNPCSNFLMLPLYGPSTVRDLFGLPLDYAASPWPYIRPWWVGTAIVAGKWVNLRAQLLPADKLIDSSFDPYVFVRDAWIQRRKQLFEENKLPYRSWAERQCPTDGEPVQ